MGEWLGQWSGKFRELQHLDDMSEKKRKQQGKERESFVFYILSMKRDIFVCQMPLQKDIFLYV